VKTRREFVKTHREFVNAQSYDLNKNNLLPSIGFIRKTLGRSLEFMEEIQIN
jgi:hypothetical protein